MAINLFCWHFWYFSAFQDFLANFNFDANMLWPTSKLMHCNIYLLQTGALSNKCSQVFPIPKWHTSVTNNILSIMTTGAEKFCNSQAASKGAMTQPPSLSLGSTNFSPVGCLWCAKHFSPPCYMPIAVFTQCTSCCAIMCYVVQWSAMHYAGSALQGIQCTSVQCAMQCK